jgi:uncharacterized spore protein YtfJ
MDLERFEASIEKARDAMTVRRVYGVPIEKDGMTVIPAAAVAGGAGGGGGTDERGNVGGGSGFGLHARPVGAFVIKDGDVRWEPVVDHERHLVINASLIAAGMLLVRSVLKNRKRR